MNSLRCLAFIFAFALSLIGMADEAASEATALTKTSMRLGFDLTDLEGHVHVLGQNDQQVARVFVFVSTTCPISN